MSRTKQTGIYEGDLRLWSQTAADKLVCEVICRYGCPHQIHFDQGREFESNLFSEMVDCKAYNTTEHFSTTFTPYKLMFGQEVRCPIDLMYEAQPDVEEIPCTEEWIQSAFETSYAWARNNLQKAAVKQKSYYDI